MYMSCLHTQNHLVIPILIAAFELLSILASPRTLTALSDSYDQALPDHEEYQHGPEGLIFLDPTGDSDLDGLNNLEEYFAGTDPGNSDTDDGGENDGSEVQFGLDPLSPADDEIEAIPWVSAIPGVEKNTLTFGVRSEYEYLKLYRSRYANTGYLLVNPSIPPTGLYVDSGLNAGTTYYYRMMAIDTDGHGSRVSPTCSATPRIMPWNLFLPAIMNGKSE